LKSSELGPFGSKRILCRCQKHIFGLKKGENLPREEKKNTKKFHDDQGPNFLTNKKLYRTGQEVMVELLH
jgi:hypothetical protein